MFGRSRYIITRGERCCAWFQIIVSVLGILSNFAIIISNIKICNTITDMNINMCVENVYSSIFIILLNMTIQPLIFFHGYNTLRLNCCSSKRVKYIEGEIDNINLIGT